MMATFIANMIIKEQDTKGAGKEKYKAYFVKTALYRKYRDDVDTILSTEGYADCIVE